LGKGVDMLQLIVVTSAKEQQDVMAYLHEKLHSEYFADPSVSVIQSGITKIDVYHSVKGVKNLVVTYRVVIVPVSMSLESLMGFSHGTNININKLLAKLDRMKAEAVSFVNVHKMPSPMVKKHNDALAKAARGLFQ
jgi:hypothetical protein